MSTNFPLGLVKTDILWKNFEVASAIDTNLDLGSALRGLRLSRGLSLTQTAGACDASKAALSAWETGTRCPRGPALVRLLDALEADGRTRAWLLQIADPRYARVALVDSPFTSPVDVGMVLRTMRDQRGLSQAELGRLVGATQATISKWESGEDIPATETFHALGFALGASVEETLALASAAGQGSSGLSDSPEEAIAQIWAGQSYCSLRRVTLLGWEAELARRSARDARWDPVFASVLSTRACLLLVEHRLVEIFVLAEKAIQLAQTIDVRLQAVPAMGALDHALRRSGRDDSKTAHLAQTWAGNLPDSPNRAWMLRQRGLALVRRGQVAEGLRWVDRSSDVDLASKPDHPEPWSHRAEMLADALMTAGDARGAMAVIGGRREMGFSSRLFVRIEHANGRAVSEAEMAWLRWNAQREHGPLGFRWIEESERRQTKLTGTARCVNPIPTDHDAEKRLWAAVLRENPG